MKFEVFRTSGPLSAQEDQKPCEEAHFVKDIIEKDVFVLLESQNAPRYKKVKTKAENKYWVIYINTLDELLELIEEVENPIVINKYENGGLSIEIYDGYRE